MRPAYRAFAPDPIPPKGDPWWGPSVDVRERNYNDPERWVITLLERNGPLTPEVETLIEVWKTEQLDRKIKELPPILRLTRVVLCG